MTNVTCILNTIEGEDDQAADELLPAVYKKLCRLSARGMSREQPGQILQATALVCEAYTNIYEQ